MVAGVRSTVPVPLMVGGEVLAVTQVVEPPGLWAALETAVITGAASRVSEVNLNGFAEQTEVLPTTSRESA